MSVFKGKAVLITGGTGSFGTAFLEHLLTQHEPRKVIIFSRDELKQSQMAARWPDGPFPVRYFVGDVRDPLRLSLAFRDVDFVVHAAALKRIETAEYNPLEVIQTNVIGTANVVRAAIDASVARVVALSTDKACSPVNLYGATKLAAEKLVCSANAYRSGTFAAVRYGNVIGSRGSVIPIWRDQVARGEPLTITDPTMTRFLITMPQAIALVTRAIEEANGGDILIPKLPSARVMDLAEAVAPGAKFKVVGLRQAEKLHESLIGPDEGSFDCGSFYRLTPKGTTGFHYASDTNRTMLDVKGICEILAQS